MADDAVPRSVRSLRSRVRLLVYIATTVALGASAFGAYSVQRVLDAREELIQEISVGQLGTAQLLGALVDQETGVRGYVLTTDARFLEPYTQGRELQRERLGDLRTTVGDRAPVDALIAEIERAQERWREDYAEPTLAAADFGDERASSDEELGRGRVLFEDVRTAVDDLQERLEDERDRAREALDQATFLLGASVALLSALLFAFGLGAWRLYRGSVDEPLQALAAEADRVSAGDLRQPIATTGPAEIVALTTALELMRTRLVGEIETVSEARAAIEDQAEALARSNRDLEQFAYVASHDLQEPLRKVASFCQLLQSRYQGQLDERADQYIDFAVDGAKRMQVLINDLLAFSRVGRTDGPPTAVDAGEALEQARANLSVIIEEAGATVTAGPMPTVLAEPTLLVAVFQNLLSNAVKFARPDTSPTIEVSARPVAGAWEFAVQDDGIGIAPEYADRVFEIFKRLHAKSDYDGTGIGLALCRKIVDALGGQIWVDTQVHGGARVCFTLPNPQETT
jgi:signal transduction histidine kinase